MGRSLFLVLSEIAPSFIRGHNVDPKDELILITCDEIDCSSIDMPPPPWHKIIRSWNQIQSSHPQKKISAWRNIMQYGHEISPGNNIYLLKQNNSQKSIYFCLLSEKFFDKALSQLIDGFLSLCSLRYIKQKRTIFHSSAIIEGNSAFLFMGESGSGKGTVCSLSNPEQYTVINDDQVFVYKDTHDTYIVTNQSMSMPGVPVKALFFLVQDTTNYLTPLSPIEAARRLLHSSMESMALKVLHGQPLRDTFAISASIARCIPSYDLHFRKSSDFWDVIHAEFENCDN